MEKTNVLTDTFGRFHNYLRISLTEKCNLRCTYCMPAEGLPLTPSSEQMTADEVFAIAESFVNKGVDKIRLTGGEPLVRKDFPEIITQLASLPVELTLTTNGVLVDRFLPLFKELKLQKINLSLDSLNPDRFRSLTLRDQFVKVMANLELMLQQDFEVKLNVVLLKGQNDQEIVDFIEWTRTQALVIRFIEFMPFRGNQWSTSKTVSYRELMEALEKAYGTAQIERLADAPNDTSKNYKIAGYRGRFAIISTVTQPFCSSCNRLRLTANGKLRNCLFSEKETDLLTAYRKGSDLDPIIEQVVKGKASVRAGLEAPDAFDNYNTHQRNRSMIRIGG